MRWLLASSWSSSVVSVFASIPKPRYCSSGAGQLKFAHSSSDIQRGFIFASVYWVDHAFDAFEGAREWNPSMHSLRVLRLVLSAWRFFVLPPQRNPSRKTLRGKPRGANIKESLCWIVVDDDGSFFYISATSGKLVKKLTTGH